MKSFKRFLLLVFCALPTLAVGQVATTAGSNLTAWNGNAGSTNNNNWNQLMNNRTGAATTAKADFGNCNSLILRCAQPKCAACTTMELAKPVVSGCVNSNKDCKKHGDDLIEFIAAQIVASAAQKQQAAELAASQAAAQAAAAQNSQQMQQMQMQMQQMQQQMQQQNANQMAQMQAALDEQKQLVAQAQAEAAAAQQAKADAENAKSAAPVGVTAAQQNAINAGVSEDVLFRQQASGEILTAIENAEVQLKAMETSLKSLFDYAGCDSRGGNCVGPKRVKVFKDKARPIFDNFDNVADELYEALETALMLGVDVSDVLMMLNGSCNRWGRYMCHSNGTKGDNKDPVHLVARYADNNCTKESSPTGSTCCLNGQVPGSCVNGRSVAASCDSGDVSYSVKGGQECQVGAVVPPQDDALCTMVGYFSADDTDAVRREWIDENYEGDRMVRIGCASSALDSVAIFSRRRGKKASTLDLDTLQRILEQDATDMGGSRYNDKTVRDNEKLQYCALSVDGYRILNKAINTKKFSQSDVCVDATDLRTKARNGNWVRALDSDSGRYLNHIPEAYDKNSCEKLGENQACWEEGTKKCWVRKCNGTDCGSENCGGTNCGTCGKWNYWNGGTVVTVGDNDNENRCKMHGHIWYSKDQVAANKFTNNDACCKQNGNGLFIDDWGKCVSQTSN